MQHHNEAMWEANRDRHERLILASESHRLIKSTRTGCYSRRERFLINIGAFLVEVGMRLKTRYEPTAQWNSSLKSS